MGKSIGEKIFALQLIDNNIEHHREYRFCKRRFKFDFALLKYKIAIEIEGGVYTKGRHVRPIGFINDCEKYNLATKFGWRIFRFPTEQVHNKSAILFIKEIINEELGHGMAVTTS
jgi:very-short-patch-repair endonuclease